MEARWNGFGCALGLVLVGTILMVGLVGCAKAKVVKPESPKSLAGVVRFTILAPGAKQVNLVGSFNAWGKDAMPMKIMDSSGWQDSETTSRIDTQLRGALIQESVATSGGNAVVRMLSYDKFQEKYRLTSINDFTTHMDVEDGTFDDAGRLVLSNVGTGTKWNAFGMTFHNRTTVFDIGDDGFKVEEEISTDGGANWFSAYQATYSRPAQEEGE